MIEQVESRIPRPVAAAVLILVLTTAGSVGEMLMTASFTVTGPIFPILFLVLAYGLWRRSGRARFWTTLLLTMAVVYGLLGFGASNAFRWLWIAADAVTVGLLLVPASSRRWFHDAR
ncbi:hypothetical protein [Micromonospora sp. NPDC051296]|uniref:hypothetical protein n=1 Tax=Micromonospora sp. NPDC051296 TaxID=3155046 RepID=UPI00342242CF